MTANQKYKNERKAIDKKIAELQAQLKAMDKRQAKNQKDCGYVGAAEQTSDTLAELISFLNH